MSTDRDVTRIVRSWMDEGVTQLPDRVLDAVLDQLPATPQRRTVWFARRLSPMNTALKFGLAAAAVVATVIIGLQFIGPANVVGPPEATPTPSAAASSESTPRPLALPIANNVAAPSGTYYLTSFPVGITFEIPATEAPAYWNVCSENAVEQAVCYFPSGDLFAGQLAFLIVTNVAADPCAPGGTLMDPPTGPSVDDLVAAITNLEGFTATTPVDITIDGVSGKQFTLTAPTDSTCEGFEPWATESRTTGMGPGEINVLRILDVDGVRVMINLANDPDSPETSAFEEVLATVQIEP